MIEKFQIADYVLCALVLMLATLGLFRGFSGTLGFVLALTAALFTAFFGWMYSPVLTSVVWQRGGGVLLLTLLVFGLVRLIVKKLVNGLLAQPSDALFGCLLGVAIGVAILLVWARTGAFLDYSYLAREVSAYVR